MMQTILKQSSPKYCHHSFKSALNPMLLNLWFMCLALSFTNISASTSGLCEKWKSYQNLEGQCIPCSKCPSNYIIVSRCEFDRDTLCRPLTDLSLHINSVVNSKVDEVKLSFTSENTTIFLIGKSTLDENKIGDEIGYFFPSIVVIILSALMSGLLIITSLYILRRCKERTEGNFNYNDPLQQSLLEDQDDEKPALNLNEMEIGNRYLAERYGKTLVTNSYVP